MSKKLIIGSEEFEFPVQGSNPDYGEEITSWAEAVTDALSTVQGPNDILETSATIANNISSFTNIPGFNFSTTEVRSINAEYLVERATTSPVDKIVETGYIEGYYDGTNWGISIRVVGDAGIEIDITSGGQMQYKSSNMAGLGYTGTIKFKARTIDS